MKRCAKCKIEKNESEFHVRKSSPTGALYSYCKQCTKEIPKTKTVICKKCGEEKLHRAKGMCDACWQSNRIDIKRILGILFTGRPKKKECQKCHAVKPASDFQNNKNTSDSLQAWCRQCNTEYKNKRFEDKEYKDKFNADSLKRYHEVYKKKDGEMERRRAYDRNNWHNNPEYRQKKQEYDKTRIRNINPIVTRQARQRYRNKKKGLEATLTIEEWNQILIKHKNSCRYCGNFSEPFHQEHKIPVSRGGSYTKENIVPACETCNKKKHSKTEKEFIAYMRKNPKEFSYAKKIP